jgi:hypothetical protein
LPCRSLLRRMDAISGDDTAVPEKSLRGAIVQ